LEKLGIHLRERNKLIEVLPGKSLQMEALIFVSYWDKIHSVLRFA